MDEIVVTVDYCMVQCAGGVRINCYRSFFYHAGFQDACGRVADVVESGDELAVVVHVGTIDIDNTGSE